ncbi:MAG: hypothetical protein R2706_08475 [Acidimicrobiales bacterium]
MNHELHHLAAAYALDALDADERRAFEAHYSSCDVCVSEVSDFRAVSEHLAEGAATPPPADLKSRVMGQVAQTRQVSPLLPDAVVNLAERRRRRTVRPLLMAAAAAVVVALVGLGTQIRTGETPAIVNSSSARLMRWSLRCQARTAPFAWCGLTSATRSWCSPMICGPRRRHGLRALVPGRRRGSPGRPVYVGQRWDRASSARC